MHFCIKSVVHSLLSEHYFTLLSGDCLYISGIECQPHTHESPCQTLPQKLYCLNLLFPSMSPCKRLSILLTTIYNIYSWNFKGIFNQWVIKHTKLVLLIIIYVWIIAPTHLPPCDVLAVPTLVSQSGCAGSSSTAPPYDSSLWLLPITK